ncbi:MAG: hypothetical protein LBH15_06640, partial [Treponema sp.]|nr:hypothetical protein [Treponema sp.]
MQGIFIAFLINTLYTGAFPKPGQFWNSPAFTSLLRLERAMSIVAQRLFQSTTTTKGGGSKDGPFSARLILRQRARLTRMPGTGMLGAGVSVAKEEAIEVEGVVREALPNT